MNIGAFLDRDGTIIEETDYLRSPRKLKLIEGAAQAIKMLNQAKIKVLVITNQSGVARGYFDLDTLEKIHKRLENLLSQDGARIDGIYYCPHHPDDDCGCRKPKTELIQRAVKDFDIDLERSFVIGDQAKDVEMGKNIGAKTILVLTGYGRPACQRICPPSRVNLRRTGSADRETKQEVMPTFIAKDILEAVKWIKRSELRKRSKGRKVKKGFKL